MNAPAISPALRPPLEAARGRTLLGELAAIDITAMVIEYRCRFPRPMLCY
jgi:hypothetical protein